MAEALIAAPNPSPDEAAFHLQQAGDGRAVEWFVRAGLRARRSAAWITAAERFSAAARLLDGDDARMRERGWLLLLGGFLLRHSNEPHVIAALDEAERLGGDAVDPVLTAYARHVRGGIRSTRGSIRHGNRELEEAVAAIDILLAEHDLLDTQSQAVAVIGRLLPEADRHDNAGRSGRDLALPRVNHQRGGLLNWIAHTGPYREVVTTGNAYLAEMSAAFGNDYRRMPQSTTCHHGMGLAYASLGMPEDARRHFALARAISTANSDYVLLEQSIWSELLLALIPYQTDDLAERSRLIAEAVRAWERCRGITIVTAGDGPPSRLRIDMLEGRWWAARKLAMDHLSGPWVGHIQGGIVTLGILDRHQGMPDDAWQRVTQLLPDGPITEPGDCYIPHVITAIKLAADLAMDANDLALARRWIDTHNRWLDWSEAILWQSDQQLLLSHYHALSANQSLARQHAEAALALASNPRQPLRLVAAQRMLGHLDTQAGDYDGAAAHLEQSLTLATACAAPFDQALTLLALAELRVATGQHDEARTLLDQARSICAPLDARPTLGRIAALGVRIGIDAPAPPDGLTTRETEVLRLIAAGHSNRRIADALFLSPRTIERHIANIYLKIDAHSKAEATEYAQRHGVA